jgi:hypothetical protein
MHRRPDVVFLDARLSADGALTGAEWASEVPFVLMSDGDANGAVNAECGTLTMPFSGSDLLDSVSDALWRDLPAANEPY